MIAIIAILAAILFPVFAKAREKARQITCASNEKQLGLAVLQYNQDNDEMYIPVNGANTSIRWTMLVYPYVKSYAVYKSPDDTGYNDMATSAYGDRESYGMNIKLSFYYRYKTTSASRWPRSTTRRTSACWWKTT